MKNFHSECGMATVAIVGILALLLIVGGGAYFAMNQTAVPPTSTPVNAPTSEQNDLASGQTRPAADDSNSMVDPPGESPTSYNGDRLAGTSAPLLDFNQADFETAKASGKLIVLYFYADWCPICRAEFPKMQAAFNQLQTDQVVAFRVNFNDDETDANEVALAREHGVAYQHTKVFVLHDQQILKSPETWETSRYITEINTALGN